MPHRKDDDSPLTPRLPLRLLAILAVSVFAFEALIMLALAALPPFPGGWEALLDAALLTVLVFPVLYFFAFRPLHRERAGRESEMEGIRRLNAVLAAVRGVNRIISRENDPDRMIQGICQKMTATRGYHSAWIALLDPDGNVVTVAADGMGDAYPALTRMLKDEGPPVCGQKALEHSGVRVIYDQKTECAQCPLSTGYAGRSALSIRLESRGAVYGILTLSMPREFAYEKAEHDLVEEIAGDIGFALKSIEAYEQRRTAQAALTASEEKYRLLAEHADEAIFIARDGRIRFPNPAIGRLTGYSPDELDGMPFSRLIHPEDREMVSNRY